MNLLPRTLEDFNTKSYWETFFQKLGNKTLEWYFFLYFTDVL